MTVVAVGAAAWLDEVRRQAMQVEPLFREHSALADARDRYQTWRVKGSGVASVRGGVSDPTAAEAEARMAELDHLLADVGAKLSHAQQAVGECLEALERMRACRMPSHAMALELYYVDCADTWSEVAREMRCSRRTAMRYRSEGIAWLDARIS